MAVVTVTKDNFDEEVLAVKMPVVLDFWGEWCDSCKMQTPVLNKLAEELNGKVKFCKVNMALEAALAKQYQVKEIPAMFVFKYGVMQKSIIGFQPKRKLLKFLKSCGVEV